GDVAGVVQVLACVLLLGAGAWIAVTRRGVARLAAGAMGALAVGGLVVIGIEHWPRLAHFVPVAVLIAAFGIAARSALRHTRVPTSAEARRRVRPATRGVLIVNPRSGGGKAARLELATRARERGLETVVLGPGDDLRELAEQACRDGADVLGIAGGDGSQALVAEVAMRHG